MYGSRPEWAETVSELCSDSLLALRNMKKSKGAQPFLYPVNIVTMSISHYPEIITHSMDFMMTKNKLNSPNPTKPNPNPQNPRYHTANQFTADIQLIFSNYVEFSGSHAILMMGR